MSTDSIPTDERVKGSVRAPTDAPRAPSLVAELVFRELVEAEAALTEAELCERTLLPEGEVRDAISELDARELCTPRRRTTDHGPRRYVATFPPESAV